MAQQQPQRVTVQLQPAQANRAPGGPQIPATPQPFMLPFSPGVHLVVAQQKDEDYRTKVTEQVTELLTRVLGVRRVNAMEHEIRHVIAPLLYCVPSAVIGRQSLGEEHAEILPYPFSRVRIGFTVLYDVLVPYLLAKYFGTQRDSYRIMARAHLGLFYLAERYLDISKRLSGVRYVSVKQPNPGDQGAMSFLGVLLLIEMVIRLVKHIRQRTGNNTEGSPATPVRGGDTTQAAEEDPLAGQCTLCLGPRRCPTATMCGHVYCWECITGYCAAQPAMPQCPLCRQHVVVQQLAVISRYRPS